MKVSITRMILRRIIVAFNLTHQIEENLLNQGRYQSSSLLGWIAIGHVAK